MDTKLKNYDKRRTTWLVSSILFVAGASATSFVGFLLYFLYAAQYGDYGYAKRTTSAFSSSVTWVWAIFIAALCVTCVALVLSVMKTGRKDSDNRIIFNWFDRLFADLQMVLGVIVGAAYLGAAYFMATAILQGKWVTNLFNIKGGLSADYYWGIFGDFGTEAMRPYWLSIFASALLLAGIFAVELAIVQSIARKLKNRCFWKKTVIGAICYYGARAVSASDKTFSKVMVFLILAALICATWIGTAVMIVLIIIFVPKWLAKYQAIKDGVNEVKSGNLSYKIPVEGDGELERLAADINDIGEAQNIAVQNELKNQRMKSELISNVSHDLKTPLTSMVSYVDLLKKEGLDSENAPEYLRIIDEKTNRLQKLTQDLFDAAKASSGDIPVSLERIEMISIANQAMAELEENLARNNIQVIFTPKAEDAYVMADGQLLWRVIENMLTNVSKYALPNSRAYIDIIEEDDKVLLEVKNMSRDQLNIDADELMERFKRGDESRNTEGSGLGLAIAKDLTNLMGGDFEIYIDGDLFKATVALNKA